MRPRAKRSSKELSRDALRERLNFYFAYFEEFSSFLDAPYLSESKCRMYFHIVQAVFVGKAKISCHPTILKNKNLSLSASTMALHMFLKSHRISKNERKCLFSQAVVTI